MTTDFRTLCADLAEKLDEFDRLLHGAQYAEHPLTHRARAAIAADRARRPAPEPPAEGEVAELVAALRQAAQNLTPHPSIVPLEAVHFTRAAELLQRQHPQPVPVSERYPTAEDCDPWGRCWAWDWLAEKWCLWQHELIAEGFHHWLPAHALPLPSGDVKS